MKGWLQEELGDRDKVRCNACAFRCELKEGQTGLCRVRQNVGGTIEYLAYDQGMYACPVVDVCGAGTFCTSMPSCNWSCSFCSTAPTTQPELHAIVADDGGEFTPDPVVGDEALPTNREGLLPPTTSARGTKFPFLNLKGAPRTPAEVVDAWQRSGKAGFAMRSSEPAIHLEAVAEIAEGVRARGGFVYLNTNGYWTPETVAVLAPLVDQVEVGFKGSADTEFMRKISGVPNVRPIFETITGLVEMGVEVLVSDIPVFHNEWEDRFASLCRFVADEVPERDYPRLLLRTWAGRVPYEGFGTFAPGIPTERHSDGSVGVDRASFIVRAAEIALDHIESVWIAPTLSAPEREFVGMLLTTWGVELATEGNVIRAAVSLESLGSVVASERLSRDDEERALARVAAGVPAQDREVLLNLIAGG